MQCGFSYAISFRKADKCGDSYNSCKATTSSVELACNLTSPEFRERKNTGLASLRTQVTEKKELSYGFAFKFKGSDKVLNDFIKTERECCSFFTLNLLVSGDKSEILMELIEIDGAKDFIKTELEF